MDNNAFNIERSREIIKLLDEKGRVTVTELEQRFRISGSTARRLLNELGAEGKLVRVHGGAVAADGGPSEDNVDKKKDKNTAEKYAIALEARKLIQDGDIIMLGGGTTILELAKLLHDLKSAVVVTDSILVAAELYKNANIEVHATGGLIRPVTGVMVGHAAAMSLKNTFVKKAFIGADSISLDYGITTPNVFEAEMEARLMAQSEAVYLLADHTKFGKVTLTPQARLNEVTHIITDTRTDAELIEALEHKGIRVTTVKASDRR